MYWVNVHYYETLNEFLEFAKQAGILLAGGTVDATAALSNVPIEKPLCIIIGNEQRGLSEAAQSACDIRYQIPMFGMSESLNLSVSAAISLYDTTSRKRQQLKCASDLTQQEQSTLRAQYYLNSVSARLSEALF